MFVHVWNIIVYLSFNRISILKITRLRVLPSVHGRDILPVIHTYLKRQYEEKFF